VPNTIFLKIIDQPFEETNTRIKINFKINSQSSNNTINKAAAAATTALIRPQTNPNLHSMKSIDRKDEGAFFAMY